MPWAKALLANAPWTNASWTGTPWTGALLTGLLLASCAPPPPEAFRSGAGAAGALDLGVNVARENCSLQRGAADARIYCGTYLAPSGRVIATAAADPRTYLTASAWRTAFDNRFDRCEAPVPTAEPGGGAVRMTCVHRRRGYRQVVLAARIGDVLYVADGIEPVAAVLPRAIGVMANRLPAVVVKTDQVSLRSQRAAAMRQTNLTGVAAVAAIEQFTLEGSRQNRDGDYVAAEAAYRRAAEIQEQQVGKDNPALAVPLARLALQVSNQGRFTESEQLLIRASRLAALPGQSDPAARLLTLHLMALDRLNRGLPAQALVLLEQAESGFLPLVPADALTARRRGSVTGTSTAELMAVQALDHELVTNQTASDALNGLIETRRYRAFALKDLGRLQEADAILEANRDLFSGRDPRLVARYHRTAGMTAASAGNSGAAVSRLSSAVNSFSQTQSAGRPLLETRFLLAAQLVGRGENRAAASECRDALATARTQKAGVLPNQVMPCLHALHAESERWGIAGNGALADMFALAQLAQGSITSRQIAVATAALARGTRNPKIRDAIQQQQTLRTDLEELYRRRADLTVGNENPPAVAAIDDKIRRAEEERQDAATALDAEAPGFAALVQTSVSARETQALLRPDEVLAVIVLGDDEGFTILARDSRLYAGRIGGGARRVDALVRGFRSSMEARQSGQAPPPFDVAAAQELYTVLFGPVAGGLTGAKTLVVAPTGSLLSVPFGALLTGPASASALTQAPFLVLRMAVTHVPSASSFVNLRRAAAGIARAPDRRPWFGFGVIQPPTLAQAAATFRSDTCAGSARALAALPRLPGSVLELEAARQLTGATPAEQLLGPRFVAGQVMERGRNSQLTAYDILHFSTHALLPGEIRCQAEPAIVTSTPAGARDASGGLLKASDIQNLDLNADLVILSACNTGGPNAAGAGESLSGLARSFFYAGARALLVTHWEADDKAMPYLTAAFLDNMKTKTAGDHAAALAMAQRTMLDGMVEGLWAHPYYWSVAAIVGSGGGQGH